MSYKVNRDVGYQPWGVTNPWVFADLSQPQRQRGQVSPLVYTTQPPYLRSAHLSPPRPYLPSSHLGQASEADARGARMERYALAEMLQEIDPNGSGASAEWQDALARDLEMLTRWDSGALTTLDSDPEVTGE